MFLDLGVIEVKNIDEFIVIFLDPWELSEVVSIGFNADIVELLNDYTDVWGSISPKGIFCNFEESEEERIDIVATVNSLHELLIGCFPSKWLACCHLP